jgi:peptidoglycan/xylan/chitin deacetylase (PgdA/CDA1 family)
MFEVSLDDGGKLDLEVANLLDKYRLKGTFYIVVNWIDGPGFLTWDDIVNLDKRGFTIGSHTCTHPQDLKKLYEDELFYEVQNSKDLIETVLGHNVTKFCYPRGRHNERVRQAVADAGYLEARVTGKPGVIEVKDKLQMPGTIHVYPRSEYRHETILGFAKKTIDKVKKEGGYCNIWGHSAEIEKFNNWKVFEKIIKYLRG